jgi:hypothetical protein
MKNINQGGDMKPPFKIVATNIISREKNQNLVGQRYSTASNYVAQTNCNFLIRGNGVNGFEGVIRVANVDYVVDFGATATGGWRSFTLTYDGAQMRSYQQGSFQNFATGPGVTLVSNGLKTLIGGTVNNIPNGGNPDTDYFDGRIAVVNIYDAPLDDQQVLDLNTAYAAKGL